MTFEPLHISSFRLERTLLSVVHRVPKEQRRRQTVKLTPASSLRRNAPSGPIRERPDPSKWNRAARISLQIPVMSNSAGIIPQRQKPPRRANYRCATRPTLPIFRHPKPETQTANPGKLPQTRRPEPGPEPNQASPPRRWSARYGESQLTASASMKKIGNFLKKMRNPFKIRMMA